MRYSKALKESSNSSSVRSYGPAVGEPPPAVDPRRWGSLIGLAGGMWFIAGYASALGQAIFVVSLVAGVVLVGSALFAHYIRPTALGSMERPGRKAMLIYIACVVGELALISVGSRFLTSSGHEDLRPALIATVVGLHFIPFAWAFGERMFYWLGSAVAVLGVIGLVVGAVGVSHAAEAAAVMVGLAMQVLILMYARGRFAPLPTARSAA